MPTGYTANIKDGITFQEFALQCARAFGALITMRDEPSDAEIPSEFKPSDYHKNKLSELTEEHKRISRLTCSECATEARKQFEKEKESNDKRILEIRDLENRYRTMLYAIQ